MLANAMAQHHPGTVLLVLALYAVIIGVLAVVVVVRDKR